MIGSFNGPHIPKRRPVSGVCASKTRRVAGTDSRAPFLHAVLVAALVLLLSLAILPACGNSSAAADDSTWIDTRGPGNGSAFALVFAPERNELYRATRWGVWRYDVASGYWSDTGGALSDYIVHSLAWDGSSIYAGTAYDGLWRYDPVGDTWTDISSGGFTAQSVGDLVWGGTGLYARVVDEIWHYDPIAGIWADISGELSGKDINTLAWDGSGIYAGTAYDGLWRYDPEAGTWTQAGGTAPLYITSLAWADTVLYAGTSSKGVWTYDPQAQTWTDISSELSSYSFRSVVWDGGKLYAGASYHPTTVTGPLGVWCYDPISATWTETGVLGAYRIDCLTLSPNDLYAGTVGHGIWRYDRASSEWVDTGGGVSDYDIVSLLGTDSNVYVGTRFYGLWSYDPASGVWDDISYEIGDNTVGYLAWDGSKLYATTGSGLWRYDPATDTMENITGGLPGGVHSVACGGSDIYVSSSIYMYLFYIEGVYRYDPATGGWNLILSQLSYEVPRPYSLKWGGSDLYASAGASGVWRYDPSTGMWVDAGGGMNTYAINCMEWGSPSLYAGTIIYGVWHYNPLTKAWTKMDGGTDGDVYSLAWDGSGLYVLTSKNGIWRFSPSIDTWTSLGGKKEPYDNSPIAWDGSDLYGGVNYRGVWRFDYSGLPVVDSISPTAGAAGTEVTIAGLAFGDSRGEASVSFGSTQAVEYTSWSDTRIKCLVPDMAAGKIDATVSTSAGISNGVPFTVTEGGISILSVDPVSALEGSVNVRFAVEGSEFQPGAEVILEQASSGTVIEATGEKVNSSSNITCTLDLNGAPLGEYDVVVKNPDNQEARLEGGFRITNLCGMGAEIAVFALALIMGLMYLAGSGIFRRKQNDLTEPRHSISGGGR